MELPVSEEPCNITAEGKCYTNSSPTVWQVPMVACKSISRLSSWMTTPSRSSAGTSMTFPLFKALASWRGVKKRRCRSFCLLKRSNPISNPVDSAKRECWETSLRNQSELYLPPGPGQASHPLSWRTASLSCHAEAKRTPISYKTSKCVVLNCKRIKKGFQENSSGVIQ